MLVEILIYGVAIALVINFIGGFMPFVNGFNNIKYPGKDKMK